MNSQSHIPSPLSPLSLPFLLPQSPTNFPQTAPNLNNCYFRTVFALHNFPAYLDSTSCHLDRLSRLLGRSDVKQD